MFEIAFHPRPSAVPVNDESCASSFMIMPDYCMLRVLPKILDYRLCESIFLSLLVLLVLLLLLLLFITLLIPFEFV